MGRGPRAPRHNGCGRTRSCSKWSPSSLHRLELVAVRAGHFLQQLRAVFTNCLFPRGLPPPRTTREAPPARPPACF
eukprot:6914941-Alexandrium_andersonii.AAC.1